MSFRFLHTADWQIGKPFANIDGDAGADLRSQRFRTVARLARIAAERQLDAVLVAGDVFDSNEVDEKTIVRLLDALADFPGPWVFLPGNHDAALVHSVWTRLRRLGPGSNIVVADRPEAIALWGQRAVVLPAPLRRRREGSDQTAWFDDAATPPSAIRVGLAHGSVAGRLPSGAEASNPIAPSRAETARLDYLALGDWHGTLKIAPRTWYSGTPETDRHRGNASGHALLVEIAAAGAPERVKAIPCGAYSWHSLSAHLVDGHCDDALHKLAGLGPEPGRCVVSLTVSGVISLAERHRLEDELEGWGARLHHLRTDLSGLIEEPTPDDLDALDTGGFIRVAVEKLKSLAAAGSDSEAGAARAALRMIYFDHKRARCE